MDKRSAKKYNDYLFAALDDFDGTVISGGTKSGIPGEVGDVAHRMNRLEMKKFYLISYLPESLPPDAIEDKDNYDKIFRTKAHNFSARELITYWTDIILSGIKPEDLIVLGINGGRISDLEYRLALGFGVKVGLVQNSGRAASGILADPDWKMHPNIIDLPQDELITWSFVHQNRPSTLSPEDIEKAAPKVHNYYIKKKWEIGDTTDNSMKPWKKLPESLKKSNRKQIAFIERVLNKVDLGMRPSKKPEFFDLDQNFEARRTYIDVMAELEHARFVVERLNEGWVAGTVKDIGQKVSPYLGPWEEIPEDIKKYDVDAVENFQELLNELGFEIYKRE
jgi:hypothetical protein